MAAKSCKDCERLQTDSTGSAPLRSSYQQPTKYDHYTNFQKFKQSKIEENYIKNRKDELTKFDSKFTDWKLDPGKIEASFDHFSTQDIARFRTQLRRYDRSVVDGDPDANNNDIDPSTRVVKKKVSLLTISRTPVQCPIAACERIIGVTSVLSHYLRDHNEEYGVQCEELYGGKRAVLIFNPICLDYGQNACMGVLAYGGVTGKREDAPAERNICMHNAFLPKPHEQFDAHLPILIMACQTVESAMLKNKRLEEKILKSPNALHPQLLIIWLVSVETTKPVYCTVTVYDKLMSSSRSSIMRVRHLNESQNPSEFLSIDSNYMRLSRGEVEILSGNSTDCIHMEIMIHEYEHQ